VTPSHHVTVGPDLAKLFGRVAFPCVCFPAGFAFFLLGCQFQFGQGWLLSSGWLIVLVIGAVVVGCGAAVMLTAIFGHRPRLEIGLDGFVLYDILGSRSRRWSDIEGSFEVIRLSMRSGVGYRLTQDFKEAVGYKANSWLVGNDEAIWGAFRLPIDELAELLNQHKERAEASS
jgi:hypothetical protein